MLGIVGIPVIDLGMTIQSEEIDYFGFRNEQAMSYAAGMLGYLSGRPGVCLAVSGPGMTNCISGMANAQVNKWPLVVLSGASDTTLEGAGGFQEYDQVGAAKPVCKYAARPNSVAHIPFIIERAFRMAMYGTPGPTYVDLPHDLLYAKIPQSQVTYCAKVEPLPPMLLSEGLLHKAIETLQNAKNPLLVVGKGVAYANAAEEMRALVEKTGIPFLATPMGKGVVSDFSPLSAARARSHALQNADVIVLCGARLNWILHFGLPPRFKKDVKIIQIDNDPLEMNTNISAFLPLCGDLKAILGQMSQGVTKQGGFTSKQSIAPWRSTLQEKSLKNEKSAQEQSQDTSVPMNYYTSIGIVQEEIAKLGDNFFIVNEGSNTMDIGRTILQNTQPKQRLDATTFGTMGIGFAFAIAAQIHDKSKKVVMVMGDSAFGFSAMELETAARYRLPLKVVIINNNGISIGVDEIDKEQTPQDIPVFALQPTAQYHLLSIAFGGKGCEVTTPAQLKEKMGEAIKDDNLWVINCRINPYATKKAQSFGWHTSKADVGKTEDPKL